MVRQLRSDPKQFCIIGTARAVGFERVNSLPHTSEQQVTGEATDIRCRGPGSESVMPKCESAQMPKWLAPLLRSAQHRSVNCRESTPSPVNTFSFTLVDLVISFPEPVSSPQCLGQLRASTNHGLGVTRSKITEDAERRAVLVGLVPKAIRN